MRGDGSGARPDPLDSPSPTNPDQVSDTPMTVIALVLAGNLLLAGLFSLVAVAFD